MLYFFILLLLVQYLHLSLSQYFLNYCGCYSNLRPLQGIAAGGIWDGRASELLSSLLCSELEVMLSTSAPPLGLAASAAVICDPGWLQKSPPCLHLCHFQFTVRTFAVPGIPRPFGIKYFVSQMLVLAEEWPPAFSSCLLYPILLRDTLRTGAVSQTLMHIFQRKIHHSSFEECRKCVGR